MNFFWTFQILQQYFRRKLSHWTPKSPWKLYFIWQSSAVFYFIIICFLKLSYRSGADSLIKSTFYIFDLVFFLLNRSYSFIRKKFNDLVLSNFTFRWVNICLSFYFNVNFVGRFLLCFVRLIFLNILRDLVIILSTLGNKLVLKT